LSAFRVILLPGIVLPAEPAYRALIAALGPGVEAVAKDLEIYATPEPPEGYSLEVEVAGILREADAHSWERFHLVGYSGGGAASLAFAATRPERLASLALLEPAWAGNWDLSPAEEACWFEFDRLEDLPHHFDPPHRIEPERLANALRTLWRRADRS
jgi:pimeloyl-ACP methyl ester carboxylesterase